MAFEASVTAVTLLRNSYANRNVTLGGILIPPVTVTVLQPIKQIRRYHGDYQYD